MNVNHNATAPPRKLVILDAFPSASTDLSYDAFQSLADTTCYERTAPSEVISRIGDAHYLITNKCTIDRHVMESCPNLSYIGITATGYNNIDLDAAKEHGIAVTNVAGYSSDCVAQFVFSYLLDAYSQVRSHADRVAAGEWHRAPDFCFYSPSLREVAGKTIGIIGFGSIARRVCRIALAFSMKVLVHTRTIPPDADSAYPDIRFVPFDTLLAQSDAISIHCPLTPQTQNLFDAPQFALMQSHAILINTARGPIVCESALADALNNDLIGAAYTDVLSAEPPLPGNPLFEAKNITITPHIAWAPQESRRRLIERVYDNLAAFQSGVSNNRII